MKALIPFIALLAIGLTLTACSSNQSDSRHDMTSKDSTKETFSILTLVEELKQTPDSIIVQLNKQHHSLKVLERRTVPGPFTPPKMKYYSEHAVTLDKLPTINPGPGEYVHVMEGQRNGYNNLTERDRPRDEEPGHAGAPGPARPAAGGRYAGAVCGLAERRTGDVGQLHSPAQHHAGVNAA